MAVEPGRPGLLTPLLLGQLLRPPSVAAPSTAHHAPRAWASGDRRLWSRRRTERLSRVVNDAVLETAPRTVNTGPGAMFVLVALTLLGGSGLTDLAFALLLGLLVGTYSSAFTAAPLVQRLEKGSSAPPPMPPRSQRSKGPSAPARPARVRESVAVV